MTRKLSTVDDTPQGLLLAKLALPSGRTLEVSEDSTQELRDAAKELRAPSCSRHDFYHARRSINLLRCQARSR